MKDIRQSKSVDYENMRRICLEKLNSSLFLRKCRLGAISHDELKVFLAQHFHYARDFTRYLCALLANLENEMDRRVLTENLFEEMGLGDAKTVPHGQIYREMLNGLGIDPLDEPVLRETIDLRDTMLGLCREKNPLLGLGALCLGAEAVVPDFYSQLLAAMIAKGFPEEQLDYFRIHIEGDDDHAMAMGEIILAELAENPSGKGKLLASALLVIAKRIDLLDAIVSLDSRWQETDLGSNYAIQF
jgi:pyrroloquinoline-quinone synthase